MSDQRTPVLILTEETWRILIDSSSEENQDRLILMTWTGLTQIFVGKIRLPRVHRLAVKTRLSTSAVKGTAGTVVKSHCNYEMRHQAFSPRTMRS